MYEKFKGREIKKMVFYCLEWNRERALGEGRWWGMGYREIFFWEGFCDLSISPSKQDHMGCGFHWKVRCDIDIYLFLLYLSIYLYISSLSLILIYVVLAIRLPEVLWLKVTIVIVYLTFSFRNGLYALAHVTHGIPQNCPWTNKTLNIFLELYFVYY